jgi:flagellar hook-associated protein FlgK
MSSISAIAVSGMSAAQLRLQASAHNIANLSTEGFRRQQVQQTSDPMGGVRASVTQVQRTGASLEADVVAQLQAKNDFLASLAVFRASDRMAGTLLDAFG